MRKSPQHSHDWLPDLLRFSRLIKQVYKIKFRANGTAFDLLSCWNTCEIHLSHQPHFYIRSVANPISFCFALAAEPSRSVSTICQTESVSSPPSPPWNPSEQLINPLVKIAPTVRIIQKIPTASMSNRVIAASQHPVSIWASRSKQIEMLHCLRAGMSYRLVERIAAAKLLGANCVWEVRARHCAIQPQAHQNK